MEEIFIPRYIFINRLSILFFFKFVTQAGPVFNNVYYFGDYVYLYSFWSVLIKTIFSCVQWHSKNLYSDMKMVRLFHTKKNK